MPHHALNDLPALAEKRLAVRVTPDALRHVRAGHPWVFDEAITDVSRADAAPGTLAVIFDKSRAFAAIGLWDPTSPIRLRVLHEGRPVQIDQGYWTDRVRGAYDRRVALEATGSTGWRWVHGENDGFSGLIVDRYATTVVVKLYTPAWLPHLHAILEAIRLVDAPERIVLRLGRNAQRDPSVTALRLRDGMVVDGAEVDGPIEFLENSLRFTADVIDGQKTGHFLDQRDNRAFVRSIARDRSILDVFSCTGGFSVHAAAGGAHSVHSVDIAAPAIEASKRHMALNDFDTHHDTTIGDAFEVLADLAEARRRFDVVIIDPPSFASRATERDGAIRAYRKLVDLGLAVLEPGGRLLQASCSSRVSADDFVATVRAGLRARARNFSDEHVFGHAADHPITFPEGAYLKAITGVVA